MSAILDVCEKQGIRNGVPNNVMKGPAFETELAKAYPECRLAVTKETMTVESMIKIVYDLLKDNENTNVHKFYSKDLNISSLLIGEIYPGGISKIVLQPVIPS